MKFVLASKNLHKAQEIREILGGDIEIVTQDAAGAGDIEIIEDGETFEDNAIKKAITVMNAINLPTIADDSGLCVDALGGRPGVRTARFAGEHATDEENITKLLAELRDVPMQSRGARFVCVIALAVPGEEIRTFRGECEGSILFEKRGENGFGYDPVFYVTKYDSSMAQLPPHIKNAISHRYGALKLLREELEK